MAENASQPLGADLRLLQPHLEPVDLPLRKVLEQRGESIKAIYFPESGFASVVVYGTDS